MVETTEIETVSGNSAPLVYVIIVTFNGRDQLATCLPAVAETNYTNMRLLLVDNASSDGSAELAKELFPQTEVIRNDSNLGFAEGNNVALRRALKEDAEYVVLLNDDTAILDRNWLPRAVEQAKRDRSTGMIGFDLVDRMEISERTEDRTMETVSHIPGCALFIRAQVLKHIGLFDPAFFAYYEEDDLEARAVRAGYKLVKLNIPLYHRGGATSDRIPLRAQYLTIRNAIRSSIKNRSFGKTFLRLGRLFDICCNPWPIAMISDDVSHRRARGSGNLLMNIALYAAACFWNLFFLPQTLARRFLDDRRIKLGIGMPG